MKMLILSCKRELGAILVLSTVIILGGCGGNEANSNLLDATSPNLPPEPTSVVGPNPTTSPVPSASPAIMPEPTAVPTAMPSPTATPTFSPFPASSGNTAPKISGDAPDAAQGIPYNFTPKATDADGDTLTFSLSRKKPGWMKFDATTGVLTGTPGVKHIGRTFSFSIIASDGEDSADLKVSITVAPSENAIEYALRTGDARSVETAEQIYAALRDEIAAEQNKYSADLIEIFGLNVNGTRGPNTLADISWDPSFNAALLHAKYGESFPVLSDLEGNDYTDLAIIGRKEGTRHLVLGSNPFRNADNAPDSVNENMHEFMRRALSWLTARKDLTESAFNVVLSQEPQQKGFRDQTANRSWLDREYPGTVNYSEARTCDGAALVACLKDDTDLLIVTGWPGDSKTEEVVDGVRTALQRGIPVMYMNYNGDKRELSDELLGLLGVADVGKNKQRLYKLVGADAPTVDSAGPRLAITAMALFDRLETDNFSFDITQCGGTVCRDQPNFYSEFRNTADQLREHLLDRDRKPNELFDGSEERFTKSLVLLGDILRRDSVFPKPDGITRSAFLKTFLGDKLIYSRRPFAEVQADMGNFSRSDFTGVESVTRRVQMVSKTKFRAAGVYAIPGRSFTVTRNDNSAVDTNIFINTLRQHATREFSAYKRPKHLQSTEYALAPGETLRLTSPQGGPIQITFNGNDHEIDFTFTGVGEHPYWRGPEDTEKFVAALDANQFDWAELSTSGFEVHSTREKMLQSVDRYNGSPGALGAATERYLSNYAHILAGFRGPGIDLVPEIHEWATANGLNLRKIDIVKHMNADQSLCGSLCSGNPYDSNSSFNPLGNGSIHELGHGLQNGRVKFSRWGGEPTANWYGYYTVSRHVAETGDELNKKDCTGKIKWRELFDALQASRNTDNPGREMLRYLTNDRIEENKNIDGPRVMGTFIQMMMAAQNHGDLENGWHLLARVHVINREYTSAIESDAEWEAKRAGLGFGDMTRAEANSLGQNDWMLIAVSHASGRDMRDYVEMWGLFTSDFAKSVVAARGLPVMPLYYYAADGKNFCLGFDKPAVPVDGVSEYPF